MTVCLNMIVRNEAHVIERCIRSALPLIDSWAICDTGSIDGTQDLIRDLLAHLPGELVERPWVDFATNRNHALALAKQHGEYALLLDADCELLGGQIPTLDSADCHMGHYLDQTLTYQRPLIIDLTIDWEWRGVLHEGLYTDQPARHSASDLWVREHHAGARSLRPGKFAHDAEVLAKALAEDPQNTRYAFYLAQSLRDAGDQRAAIDAYRHRASMGGWDEEVWYSLFQIAVLTEAQGENPVVAYLTAYDYRPTRAEPLRGLAAWFRHHDQFANALLISEKATRIPRPADILFLDTATYDWCSWDELAVAAYQLGDYPASADASRRILQAGLVPEPDIARVQANLEFAMNALPDPKSCTVRLP